MFCFSIVLEFKYNNEIQEGSLVQGVREEWAEFLDRAFNSHVKEAVIAMKGIFAFLVKMAGF